MVSPSKSILIVIGVLLVCGLIIWVFPCPTQAQMFTVRLVLAFGLGVCGSLVPGFFTLSIGTKLRVGTGLILFVTSFLLTPRLIEVGDCRASALLDGYVRVNGTPASQVQLVLGSGGQQTVSGDDGYFALELNADQLGNTVQLYLSGAQVRDSAITISKREVLSSLLLELSLQPALYGRSAFTSDFDYYSYRYIMAISKQDQEGTIWRAKATRTAYNPEAWLQIGSMEMHNLPSAWQQALIDTQS